MKVQRVEGHSYQLVYEYDIPDEDIIQEFGDTETFKEQLASDDEDFDEAHEFIVELNDPEECYKWEYSQIKGGYETEFHADEDCITPRGEPL